MTVDEHFIELGTQLTGILLRNTAGAINTKIKTAKAKQNDAETIQELEEIITSLITDKNELAQIAQAYKQEFVAQQISAKDIKYITDKFLPVVKDLLVKSANGDAAKVQEMEKTIDSLAPLLSVETLTVLQLLGFNFKKAVGEPLTALLQKTITTKVPLDPTTNTEQAKILLAYNTELLKVAQDKDATERYEKLRANSNS